MSRWSARCWPGSARTGRDDPAYAAATETARLLAEAGFAVITGGGPGIMEAANRGAREAGGKTIGLNISLPMEQEPNPYITPELNFEFHYFFMRKLWFAYLAKALVVFPGGFGTLDEAMEVLTLVQTGKNPPIPLILIDDDRGDYWENWFQFVKKTLLKKGLISGEDFSLFSLTRDPAEAVQLIDDFYRVYHSSRFVHNTLVIRLNKPLTPEQVETLEKEFQEIINPGSSIQLTSALPEEKDQPDLLHLPRLTFEFNRRSFGLLKAFIRRLNSF